MRLTDMPWRAKSSMRIASLARSTAALDEA